MLAYANFRASNLPNSYYYSMYLLLILVGYANNSIVIFMVNYIKSCKRGHKDWKSAAFRSIIIGWSIDEAVLRQRGVYNDRK